MKVWTEFNWLGTYSNDAVFEHDNESTALDNVSVICVIEATD
jgi:hypothetical protein